VGNRTDKRVVNTTDSVDVFQRQPGSDLHRVFDQDGNLRTNQHHDLTGRSGENWNEKGVKCNVKKMIRTVKTRSDAPLSCWIGAW